MKSALQEFDLRKKHITISLSIFVLISMLLCYSTLNQNSSNFKNSNDMAHETIKGISGTTTQDNLTGISLRVETDKENYSIGEPVHVCVYIENSNNYYAKIRVFSPFGRFFIILNESKFVIWDSHGPPLPSYDIAWMLVPPMEKTKITDSSWNQKYGLVGDVIWPDRSPGSQVTLGQYLIEGEIFTLENGGTVIRSEPTYINISENNDSNLNWEGLSLYTQVSKDNFLSGEPVHIQVYINNSNNCSKTIELYDNRHNNFFDIRNEKGNVIWSPTVTTTVVNSTKQILIPAYGQTKITDFFWNQTYLMWEILDGIYNLSWMPIPVGRYAVVGSVCLVDGGYNVSEPIYVSIVTNNKLIATIVSVTPNTTKFGDEITLIGYGNDPDGSIVAYQWRINDTILGTNSTLKISNLSVGKHTIYFKVQDNDGNWSNEVSTVLEIKENITNVNRPPEITNYSAPANLTLKEGENFTFNVSAIDLDVQNLTYNWYLDNVSVSNNTNYTLQTNYISSGTYNITVVVSDGESNITKSWLLNVTNVNLVPTAQISSVSPNPTNKSDEITFVGYGNDTDGTIITYQWRTNDTILGTNSTLKISNLSVGKHTLYFKVQDNDGNWSDEVSTIVEIKEKEKPASVFIPSVNLNMIVISVLLLSALIELRRKTS